MGYIQTLRILLLVLLFTSISACGDSSGIFSKISNTKVSNSDIDNTVSKPGRYHIYGTPRETILVDSMTGRSWVLSTKNGVYQWLGINLGPGGKSGGRFEILSIQDNNDPYGIRDNSATTNVPKRLPGETIPEYLKRTKNDPLGIRDNKDK